MILSGSLFRLNYHFMHNMARIKFKVKVHAMKAYWEVEVWRHSFLTSALDVGEWSDATPGHFIPRRRAHGAH